MTEKKKAGTEKREESDKKAGEVTMDKDYEKLLKRAEKELPEQSGEDVRFKLPAPDLHRSGNRTFFKNFKELADRCRRDPNHLLKFLNRELGTSGNIDGPQAIFTGKFTYDQVKIKITTYVKEFVKCSECGKPDTILKKEQRHLILKCEACGAKHPVRSL